MIQRIENVKAAASEPRPVPWPCDAVMIVAADRGREMRATMECVCDAVCRDCGRELAVDARTIQAAMEMPQRQNRPVRFFCCACAVRYDGGTIQHLVDRRRPV